MHPLAERIQLAARAQVPLVMGILNVTPDSFSDGGRFDRRQTALAHARTMVEQGADLIDVGGESTRPGAEPVPVDAELERVVPVIEAIRAELDVAVSIDTMKPAVMRGAVAAGATMINDVNGLQAEGALEAAVELAVPTCVMHMQGEPRTMQAEPRYEDVTEDLLRYFRAQIARCLEAGMAPGNLVLDPGFGFGKTLAHNLQLLDELPRFATLGYPLLIGVSRKSMLGAILERDGRPRPADQRVAASVAAALLAAERGGNLLRVHDVAETVDAVRVLAALRQRKR